MEHSMSNDEVISLRKKHFCSSQITSYNEPLMFIRGEKQYLFTENGEKYLDAYNNVMHVGHSHPRVCKAAFDQMQQLSTNTRYLHQNLVKYAQKLTSHFPPPLSVCFFVNSGSEANDLAVRLAKKFTGNSEFIVLENAYHGNTNTCVELSPTKSKGPGGVPTPSYVHKVMVPDTYRGPYKRSDPLAGQKYAEDVQRTIQRVESDGKKVAAFFCESIQGCGGQIVLCDGYLKECYKHVRSAGGICVADEVQVGFGRVGTHFWGFETQGVVPDIVTMGKPIGNGFPLGCVVTTPAIAEAFSKMEYFNTFGGNPVSCAVGITVLDVIEEEKLQQNALETGNYLRKQLEQVQKEYNIIGKQPIIGDVRGLGLYVGIEFVLNENTLEPAPIHTKLICEKLKEMKILTGVDGPFNNVLRIKPPICFNKDNADQLVGALSAILNQFGEIK